MISKRGLSRSILLTVVFTAAALLAACGSATQSAAPTQAEQPPQADATRQPGCTVVSRKPTPGPTEQSLLPPPGEKDWVVGPADAALTITEYSDFQ